MTRAVVGWDPDLIFPLNELARKLFLLTDRSMAESHGTARRSPRTRKRGLAYKYFELGILELIRLQDDELIAGSPLPRESREGELQ